MLEQAIIGGMFLYPDEMHTVLDILTESDFRNEGAKSALRAIISSGCSDPVVIGEKIGLKAEILNQWMDTAVGQVFIKRECLALKEKSRVLQIKDLGRKIITHDGGYEELATLVSSSLVNIAKGSIDTAKDIGQILSPLMKILESRHANKGKIHGIPSGFADLDEITTGGHPGELWVVAGRPGMGKSAFGANLIENAAENGYSGMFFSTEMAHEQLTERILSSRSRVNFSRMRHGNFETADWSRMTEAAGDLNHYKIRIDKCPGITPQELKSRIYKNKRNGLDLVVIDYLQRMNIPGENRSRAVGEVTRELKDIALDLGIWIVVLSQLNRGVDSRSDKRPTMSDLRDSGEIEQDADVILFPYREAAYCEKCKKREEGHDVAMHQAKAELILEKQRNGPAPYTVPVVWLRELVKFQNAYKG